MGNNDYYYENGDDDSSQFKSEQTVEDDYDTDMMTIRLLLW